MEANNKSSDIYPVNNPSDYERYIMIENELKKDNRIEDLDNIIESMNPPKEIKSICESNYGKKTKVAIIGAGEAGLAAAFELKKIGCSITVFDASKRIGGRVYTYYFDRLNNHYGDFGEISIPISHFTTWHYINLFNLKTRSIINNNQYYYLRGEGAYSKERQIIKNIYPKYNLTNIDKRKIRNRDYKIDNKYLKSLTQEEKKELINISNNYSEKIINLDKISYRKAYEKLGFSQEAINMIGYINGSNEFYDDSLIEVLQKQYSLDFSNNYTIEGGMIKLPLELYKAIIDDENDVFKDIDKKDLGNVNTKFGVIIEEIYNANEKEKISLKYLDLDTKIEGEEEFDYVICAIPFSSLKRINIKSNLSNGKLRAIDEIDFKNSQKIYLYVKERFWESGGKNKRIVGGRTITDLPLYSIYYPSDHGIYSYDEKGNKAINISGNYKEPGVLLASYSLGNKARDFSFLDDEIKINDTIRYIERIHNLPREYLNNILIDYKSISWADIQYIWGFSTLYKPGDKALYSFSTVKPEMNNKLFFAGEHVSSKHGTQQGALQSGMIAANNIAEEIVKKYSF
ncbi:flavin monoamine oxidase family protein [Clostridium nigeriense]|uniref:flavin monoamine oxidase family protein n=1 Tax=Clostridium nigeriense TaxID=1805470 RepID=UPI003D34950E